MAAPLAIPIIASVVRNDGIPTRVVSQPLNMPTTNPVASPANTPAIGPAIAMAMATVTVAKPATEPTERSISPADKTNVIAMAITAIIAVCRMMFRRLLGFKNPLSESVTAKIKNNTIKPM